MEKKIQKLKQKKVFDYHKDNKVADRQKFNRSTKIKQNTVR